MGKESFVVVVALELHNFKVQVSQVDLRGKGNAGQREQCVQRHRSARLRQVWGVASRMA